MAILHFWRSNPEIVLGQTIQQIVSNAGDGNLRDGSPASFEFREFLALVPSQSLFTYARQCLETPFQKSGSVLQDVVNELGRRLDFEVENGLYQGRKNAIGFDGIWRFNGESELVVEVKSTDAYTFPLEKTSEYREELIAQAPNPISRDSSILIVVGREDTGALEAQVRGSRFAWDIRLISIDSLIKLVQIRAKSDDMATVRQIHQVLRPFEYTKVDRIIEILFTTAADVESQQEESQFEPAGSVAAAEGIVAQAQEKTARAVIEDMKDLAIRGFSSFKGTELIRRGRSYFWSADKVLRACCTVSKRYNNDYQPYWFAYHPKWDEFLLEGDGYLILACMGLESAFAIPQRWLAENAANFNATEREESRLYWHIPLTTLDGGKLAINLSKVGRKYPLEPHRFLLAVPS
ncbi:MAG: hypothetical protein INH43_06930 [Acidobacteriaceae bacterium]|nr:hypothetical protein [Acidobacteriaceae bacterium]